MDLETETVATKTGSPEGGLPFSIYLQLKEGTHADLEVVAKSSLALISAIREVLDFADPTIEVKVTIQDGERGSLRINTHVETQSAKNRKQGFSGWFVAGATVFLLEATAGHYYSSFLQWVDRQIIEAIQRGEDPEEVRKIADECSRAIQGAENNEIGALHIKQFYSVLLEDPNIIGVGISPNHRDKPANIIPKQQFFVRSQPTAEPEEDYSRDRVERTSVLLVQPRLLGDEKPWRFSAGGAEFAAKVEDRQFKEDTLSGRSKIPLIEGVYLDVDLRLFEVKIGDAWRIKSRVVQHVYGFQGPGIQDSLFSPT